MELWEYREHNCINTKAANATATSLAESQHQKIKAIDKYKDKSIINNRKSSLKDIIEEKDGEVNLSDISFDLSAGFDGYDGSNRGAELCACNY